MSYLIPSINRWISGVERDLNRDRLTVDIVLDLDREIDRDKLRHREFCTCCCYQLNDTDGN